MPQPTQNQVHIDSALTNISTAYIQAETNYIAAQVFPPVPVQHQSDKYWKFRKGDFFRDEAQVRAGGTESAGTGYNMDQGSYLATVYGLHKDIDDQVRRNADPAINLDVVTTKNLMQKMLIKRDRIFVSNYLATGVWGTDITGVASGPSATQTVYWSDDTSDPITDVATGQTTIMQNTGFAPNTLVLSWPVYQALRKHPLIVDRIKITPGVGAFDVKKITPELLAGVFDVEKVVVARAVYNSAAEGATDSFSFIAGKHALLCYANPSPGLEEPSAGYLFPWVGLDTVGANSVAIYQIPMPWLGRNTVRTEAEMAFDMQVVGSDLGYFFSGIVS